MCGAIPIQCNSCGQWWRIKSCDCEKKSLNTTCAVCDIVAKFVYEDLPTGPQQFCSERCFCVYTARPYKGEGYYTGECEV